MPEIVEREPLGIRVCVLYITWAGASQPLFVGRIGQHGLSSREAMSREVGARSVRRAAPGYNLDIHDVETTEELKYLPLGCRTRKLAWLDVTTACCATCSVCHSAMRQGCSRCWQNGFNRPVLKHGPRSLAYVRVLGCQTRNA